MGKNRLHNIRQGDDSLQLLLSSKDVLDVRVASTGNRSVQVMGTFPDTEILKLIDTNNKRLHAVFQARKYAFIPQATSSFSNISITDNSAFVIVSAGDPISVEGITGGKKSVVILGQMSLATINLFATEYGVKFDPTDAKGHVYKLIQV
jgi:hypothetical protein